MVESSNKGGRSLEKIYARRLTRKSPFEFGAAPSGELAALRLIMNNQGSTGAAGIKEVAFHTVAWQRAGP
jgi:hypothetical protein